MYLHVNLSAITTVQRTVYVIDLLDIVGAGYQRSSDIIFFTFTKNADA